MHFCPGLEVWARSLPECLDRSRAHAQTYDLFEFGMRQERRWPSGTGSCPQRLPLHKSVCRAHSASMILIYKTAHTQEYIAPPGAVGVLQQSQLCAAAHYTKLKQCIFKCNESSKACSQCAASEEMFPWRAKGRDHVRHSHGTGICPAVCNGACPITCDRSQTWRLRS